MTEPNTAQQRREEIITAASRLFYEKGYDNTSIADILKAAGVARGTLYRHFESKERIMEGMIEKHTAEILRQTLEAANNPDASVMARFAAALEALKTWVDEKPANQMVLSHLHSERNLAMHHKVNNIMLQQLPPILASITEDGVRQGMFQTPYPLESMELAVAYVQAVFNDNPFHLTRKERNQRVAAYVFNLERILGTKPGALKDLVPVMENFKAPTE